MGLCGTLLPAEGTVSQLFWLYFPSPLLTSPTTTGTLPLTGEVTATQSTMGNAASGAKCAFSFPRPSAGSSSADKRAWPPLPDAHWTLKKGRESWRGWNPHGAVQGTGQAPTHHAQSQPEGHFLEVDLLTGL